MRRVRAFLFGVAVLSLVSGSAFADSPEDVRLHGELIVAINKRDVAGVASRVQMPLRLRRMRFDAPACAQFSGDVEVDEQALPSFVRCLADLGVKHLDGVADEWINAVYGPGIPLKLTSMRGAPVVSFTGWADPDRAELLIEPVTFSSHIKKFSRSIVPARSARAALDASNESVAALVELCVDGSGKITSLDVEAFGGGNVAPGTSDPDLVAYQQLVTKAARRWSIKAFKLGRKPMAACSRLRVGYPVDRIPPMQIPAPPPPPPPPTSPDAPNTIPPKLLEGHRIAGNKAIVPDDATKRAIRDAKRDRTISTFKLCVSDKGVVKKVTLLKSSGFPAYDAKIMREMNQWAYRPYMLQGKAVPVCTAVTFIYSQK